MFVVNIQFKVPMKSKPPDRITSLSVTLSSSENMNVRFLGARRDRLTFRNRH